MKISRVTGFPFHPSADKQKGTFHVLARILHAIDGHMAKKNQSAWILREQLAGG